MPAKRSNDEIEEIYPLDEVRPGKVPCPVCKRAMRIEKKGPVEVDVCGEHGVWLDKGELERILSAMRGRAARVRHLAVKMERSASRRQPHDYGWWSLFEPG
ncbi:MAG: zf-TFIIB domain-containing protein [Planctomycetes bacterium]|nr:zf-TFIIB domain-containing protein [Planctomycetota bacterium]